MDHPRDFRRTGRSADRRGRPVLTGELDIHTTWTEADGLAHVTVQYSGGSDWLPLAGSPVPCPSEEASRALHDAVIHSVRAGAILPLSTDRP